MSEDEERKFEEDLKYVVNKSKVQAEGGITAYFNLKITEDGYFGAPERIRPVLRADLQPMVTILRNEYTNASYGYSLASACANQTFSIANTWPAVSESKADEEQWKKELLQEAERLGILKQEINNIKNVVSELWPHLNEPADELINITNTPSRDFRAISNALRNLWFKVKGELVQALRKERQILQNDEEKMDIVVEKVLSLFGKNEVHDNNIITQYVRRFIEFCASVGEDSKVYKPIEKVKMNAIINIETFSMVIRAIDPTKFPRLYIK